jgi:hypothetical protein
VGHQVVEWDCVLVNPRCRKAAHRLVERKLVRDRLPDTGIWPKQDYTIICMSAFGWCCYPGLAAARTCPERHRDFQSQTEEPP